MSVFRPSYHSPIYEPATYSTKNGKRYAKFRLPKTGKMVTGEVVKEGKARLTSPLWYARIRRNGKSVRVPLGVADKEAALAIRQQLQRDADLGRAGIVDRLAEHRNTPLTTHLANYCAHLEASGYTERHIADTTAALKRLLLACNFYYVEEFDAQSLTRYLAGVIKKGRSFRTRNKELKNMRAFVRWMGDLVEKDPFRSIQLLNEVTDPKRRCRRALTQDELTRLCEVAITGPVRRGVAGPERALIYALAVTTGLRARELALLSIRDLRLDDEIPHIVLPAAVAKNRQEAALPLHAQVAVRLQDFTKGRTGLVFNLIGPSGNIRTTGHMIKADCKAAGIERSNSDGHVDFHALRTTFITNVCRSGADMETTMKLARHSKHETTFNHYFRVTLPQKAEVLQKLTFMGNPKVNGC